MSPIFIVIGAPAVGKSTIARALAARFAKSSHIPVDTLRDMAASGLTYPGRWNEALVEQLTLARASACHMARSLKRSGGGAEHAYIAAGIDYVYESLAETLPQLLQQGWQALDTTELTVDQTVTRIFAGIDYNQLGGKEVK